MDATSKAPGPQARTAALVRRVAVIAVALLALVALLGFVVAPPLVKSKAEELLTRELARPTTIERVAINPFTLTVTVQGLVVREAVAGAVVFSLDELLVDASITSLWRWAPVVDRLRLTRPALNLVREADRRYNLQDLIDRALAHDDAAAAAPPREPARFSLFNIEMLDGRLDFDDRVVREQHEVRQIGIGVPFVSSLPHAREITVEPRLHAVVDGAPLAARVQTQPFRNTNETTIAIDVDRLALPRFVDYLPLRFEMRSGALDTRLQLRLVTVDNEPRELTLSGTATITDAAFVDQGQAPLLAWQRLAVDLEAFDVFRRSAALRSLRLEQPAVHVVREADGALNLLALLPTSESGAAGATKPEPATPGFAYRVDELVVTGGRAQVQDRSLQPRPFVTELDQVELTVHGLSSEAGATARVQASFDTDGLGRLNHEGTLQTQPALVAEGRAEATGLRLARLYPYLASLLTLDIADGTLDAAAAYVLAPTTDGLGLRVRDGEATVRSLRLHGADEAQPVATVPLLQVRDASVDHDRRQVTIGEATLRDAVVSARRDRNGTLNLVRLLRPADAAPAPGSAASVWRVDARRVQADNLTASFDDRLPARAVVTRLGRVFATVENLSNDPSVPARLAMRGSVNGKGGFAVRGTVTAEPLAADLDVETNALEFAFVQPYLDDRLNVALTAGALTTRGHVRAAAVPGRPLALAYRGQVGVANLAAVDKATEEDVLNWKSLELGGVDVTLEPLAVSVDEVALSDYFARIILSPEGRLNLQDLLRRPGDTARSVTAVAPAASAPVGETVATPRHGRTAEALDATHRGLAAAIPPQVRIGSITLQGGHVLFTDLFVRPNYTANLTGIAGAVTEMTATQPGSVELRGKVDDAAPVEIVGRVNALSNDLFVDLAGSATDIELPPLSPYAIKYAGYGIERGKMSMRVKYLIEQRKLEAQNQLVLDQLTFGDKVDSPTATQLPVLFAVSLLKDKDGVIDINLPISGSIDDPQFSLWGLIGRVVVNLLTKIVTAPFSALASIAGGPDELSFVAFEPGEATLDDGDVERLKALSKALADRPQLRLDVRGRADPDGDREALRAASVERKVRQQKWQALRREGRAPATADEVAITPDEHERYLRLAYRAEDFPKPRTEAGRVKDLTVAEMETLMLAHAQVDDEALRQLANQRAQAVKEWLVGPGGMPAGRVFLVAPALGADAVQGDGGRARVEFALR